MEKSDKKPKVNLTKDYAKFTGLGIQIAASLLISLYGGIWLDEKFDTKPLFLLVGVFFGMLAGIWSVIKITTNSKPKTKPNNKSQK